MENKKYWPLKITHLVIMTLGLGFSIYTLFGVKDAFGETNFFPFAILNIIANIFALVSGILYLVFGYKKEASAYYKGFVWVLLINEILLTVVGSLSPSYLNKFVYVIGLVLLTILATGKDLGKIKSFILVGVLFVAKIILLINYLVQVDSSGAFDVNMLLGYIEQIILIATTCLMVCGKYLDKETRGTK